MGSLLKTLSDVLRNRGSIKIIRDLIELLDSLEVVPTRFNKEICQAVLTFYFQQPIILIEP